MIAKQNKLKNNIFIKASKELLLQIKNIIKIEGL